VVVFTASCNEPAGKCCWGCLCVMCTHTVCLSLLQAAIQQLTAQQLHAGERQQTLQQLRMFHTAHAHSCNSTWPFFARVHIPRQVSLMMKHHDTKDAS
jgi:hypothetical protein